MVNILQLEPIVSTHAHLTGQVDLVGAKIELTRPWGSICFHQIGLESGWYWLRVDAPSDDVCLQLTNPVDFKLIELKARPTEPAFVYLPEGVYVPELFAGVRPGSYDLGPLTLEPLPSSIRYRLFARRALQALLSGISLRRIISLVKQTLKPRAAFGVRRTTSSVHDGLVQADKMHILKADHIAAGPICLVRYANGLIDEQHLERTGLTKQTYTGFTRDENAAHDIVVVIGQSQTLTPDALALFILAFADDDDVSFVIADARAGDVTTARVAFDPLLYGDNYPLPHAYKRTFTMTEGGWAQQQSRFAVVNVPLAEGIEPYTSPAVSYGPPSANEGFASIIIPTRDRADLLANCVDGLFENTAWPHEVIIVDNGSMEAETFQLLASCEARGAKIIRSDAPFNFSSLCNLGAESARGDYLVFLNNDVVLTQPRWLERMIAYAALPDAGAVGARLLYADKRLQHGGVFLGLTELCGHLWRGLDYHEQQRVERLRHNSLRLAVTGALMCLSREKFESVGGFDEDLFPVTLNDVDLCLRLYARGWFNIYAADVEAFHLEGESRGQDMDDAKRQRRLMELENFFDNWKSLVERDPWLPRSIARSTEVFQFK